MGKRLLILLGAVAGCIFLIELILSVSNPFAKETDSATNDAWEREPVYSFAIEPEHFDTRKTCFLLGGYPDNSPLNTRWLEHILSKQEHNTFVRLADISSGTKFLHKTKTLEHYLSEHLPTLLILQLDASVMGNCLEIPNHTYQEEQVKIPVLTHEPEVLKTVKNLSEKQAEEQEILFNPFEANRGYPDSVPYISKKILSKGKSEAKILAAGIKRLHKSCKKEGITLVVIPAPILWDTSKRDRYSKIPLDKIVLQNETPTAWYAQLYELMLEEIKKHLPKEVNWIDLYKSFPADSRFYSDGFRLNERGHELFGEMYLGRVKTHKGYRALF